MAMISVARSFRLNSLVLLLSSTFLCLCSAAPINMQAPFGQGMQPGAPMTAANDPFSPENIAQVAEEIGKLSPEQQEQLYKESLEFLSTELKMAPEEVEKMIMDEFVQGGTPAPEEETIQRPTTTPAKETSPTKAPEKSVPVKDLTDVATLLKNLADITDTIMRKASGLPDLPSRVDRWSEQRQLQSWQKGVTWARFKQQLELFVQKAGKLQTRDPKTQNYIYLPNLLSNISLKNNLEHLYRTLQRYNELFVVSGFGIDTMLDNPLAEAGSLSTEAKEALIKILSAYAESFYSHTILKEFDALIEKFDPAAKKLRAEEEASAKKALEKSKESRQTVRIKTAGRGDYEGGSAGYYGDQSSGGYYPSSDYSGYSGGYSPSGYGYGPYAGYGDQTTTPDASTATSSGSSKSADKKDTEASKISSGVSDKTKPDRSYLQSSSKDIAHSIKDLDGRLQDIVQSDAFKKESALSATFAQSIIDTTNSVMRLLNDIEALNVMSKNLPEGKKHELYSPIISTYETYQKSFADTTTKFEAIPYKTLSAEKQYAYFGKQPKKWGDAQKELQKVTVVLQEVAALPENNLTNDLADKMATMTRRPLTGEITKEQAQEILSAHQEELVQNETTTKALVKNPGNISALVDQLKKLNSTIAALPREHKTTA